jgi:hypothetical protein
VISAVVIGVLETCDSTISDAISMSFLDIGESFSGGGKWNTSWFRAWDFNGLKKECNDFRIRLSAIYIQQN